MCNTDDSPAHALFWSWRGDKELCIFAKQTNTCKSREREKVEEMKGGSLNL